MSQCLELLGKVALFSLLDDDERQALLDRLDRRRYEGGEMLFARGDPGSLLFLIVEGRVRMFLENTIGDTVNFGESLPGDILGEVSLFDGGPRTASAVALEPTEVLVLRRDQLEAFLTDHPLASLDFLAVMGRRLRHSADMIQSNVTRNLNIEEVERMTFGERIADRVATFGGSWPFILFFAAILLVWIAINVLVLTTRPFDPYPFILLNLVLSTLAALQAPVIMMSQNRQSAKDRLRADLDYEINLKAELEIAQLHRKVDRIYERLQERLLTTAMDPPISPANRPIS